MSIKIRKADGTLETFKVEKLRRSLRRAGAGNDEINAIVDDVYMVLYDGVQTQEIYRHAFQLLRHSRPPVAARYSLRRALFNLGPTGFPFEKFLARLFAEQGYVTQTGIMLTGSCATHEIDLVACRNDHTFVGEAKFHSRPGIKSDLQVAMYSYARLLDLKGQKVCGDDQSGISDFWLITNTKFTTTAIKYCECVGVTLLSWNYPKRKNLHDLIQELGVYPVTVLQNLSAAHTEALIARQVILCSDLVEQEHLLRHLHLSARKHEAVMAEARALCNKSA